METEAVESRRAGPETELSTPAANDVDISAEVDDEPSEAPALRRTQSRREPPAWLNGLYAAVCLYLFLSAINVMGGGLKTLGHSTSWLETLLSQAHNPFISLMGAVLVTAIVQSSSFTTSLIITLVAAGQMDTPDAVFAVMGANIGTSVTNIIVAFGNVRIRRQFQRAFTAALVHDIFNWLTVLIIFPVEWMTKAYSTDHTGILMRFSYWMAEVLGLEAIERPNSPVKVLTRPVVGTAEWISDRFFSAPTAQGLFLAILGVVLLFFALVFMVKNLRGALLQQIEGLFRKYFFRNDLIAYIVGLITTIFVQSSSVTTSLIVPLAGAGAVKIKRVFPYTLGANLGTTFTGVIAATANPVAAAVSVAVAHVTFNVVGTLIWYPLRDVPIGISRWYAKLAAENKKYAFGFLIVVFLVLPGVGIVISKLLA